MIKTVSLVLSCLLLSLQVWACVEPTPAAEQGSVAEEVVQKTEVTDSLEPMPTIQQEGVKTEPLAQEKIEAVQEKASSQPVVETPKPETPAPQLKEVKAAPAPAAEKPTKEAEMVEEPAPTPAPAPKPEILKPSHAAWNALLKEFVTRSGKVNYKGLKAQSARLQAYLDELAKAVPGAGWSRNEAMAYWINAYNAFTVKLILDHYPLQSITKLNKPWDQKFIQLAGKSYSLNQIEHEILRKQYFDPRIHFVVNCASFSCPTLLNQAFLPETLNSQLARQATAFINDTRHNSISADQAEISQLFEWYNGDFTKKSDLIQYLNKYSKTKLNPDAKLSFRPYNWNLNE
ncbi:MAG: DUF547 domain-containing protein [Bacteroidota bacterium]